MTDQHISHFHTLLGAANVLTPTDELTAYEQGWRGERGKAAYVLKPEKHEDVEKILTYACAHNLTIIPQGANTGLVGASVPDDSGAQGILSFERMNKILAIDPINRTAHVQAGCQLSALNTTLADHHLYFPIDLGADPTIGGMIATNTGGGRLLKYGGVRENTLGLRAVLRSGASLDLLTALRKNNTGLDLKHLFIGTGGTVGIVTEAIVNLSFLPQQTATALLIPRTPESVSLLLHSIERSCGSNLSAFEGMSGEAMKRALVHTPTLTNPFGRGDIPPFAILLELTRTWPDPEDQYPLSNVLENVLAQLWDHADTPLDDALIGDPAKLWALRHALSEGVQKSGRLIAFDVALKRGDVMAFLMQMQKQLPQKYPDITICDFGHIGDGGIHFNLVAPRDAALDEEALRTFVYDIIVYDYHGSFSAEHGIGPKNQMFYERYVSQPAKTLIAEIKNACHSPLSNSKE